MCFGLPWRVTNTVTESVTMPLYLPRFHLGETRWAPTRRVMSGSRAKATMSAESPFFTARLCWPDGPYDWLKPTPLPAEVFWKAGMIWL